MAEKGTDENRPPDWFVNTATAPRVFGVVMSAVVTCGWLFMLYLSATHPLWGLGLNHPLVLGLAGLMICMGLGMAIYSWCQSDEAWRKVPDGPLSSEFRALADAGKIRAAMLRLREETGCGLSEAQQVVDLYLAQRIPEHATIDSPPI